MTVALIPVKRLEDSKSRLLDELADRERQTLTLAMLEDLLEALRATRGIDRIAVTTPDPLVAERARAAGAVVLIREEPGLNGALEDGIERLIPKHDEDLLIVLGDVAGASASDFERLLTSAAGRPSPNITLAPSSDGGTSALLHHPARAVACLFGRDSAKSHRDAAREAGIDCLELPLESLAIDLDQPEDLDRFLATQSGGRRTRELLEARRQASRA